jgi:lipid II:glycine glycyltransferase (peptidoglycan interpeptide bridge formation enzyme)
LRGTTKTEESVGGNEFMIWELIKKAKKENYKYFDLVGANNKNLCKFKSKFNPSLDFTYSIKKQDRLGSLAEALYTRLLKKDHSAAVYSRFIKF